MFTNKTASYCSQDKVLIEAACLSTDTKPTTGVANGSKCIEMDTGKTYMFNEEDSEWEELPSSGGGGGGSSDFSTATVTVTKSRGKNLCMPYIIDGEHASIIPFVPSTGEYTAVLYKGFSSALAIDMDDTSSEPTVTVTGNATADGPEIYITGDCTITIS